MEEVTLEKLAKDVGTTVDRLAQQFAEAGMNKNCLLYTSDAADE